MKIKLNEISENGETYTFNRNTGELNEDLKDLIHANAYDVNLYIKPLNSRDFTVNGSLKTFTEEQCSRCAEDFKFNITKKINEILIPAQEQERTSKYAKSSVNTEGEEISVSEYSKQVFEVGEFLHEAIALEVSFAPLCESCAKPENDKAFIYDEKMGEDVKPNPFQALKGLKLN
ncbi:MAG: YceD family protein [Pseudobdellovibrio sp.]